MLRTISGHEKEKVSGSWRKFQHSELHEQYSSANVIRDMKEIEDEIGVAHGIYRIDGKCICTKFWSQNMMGTAYLKEPGRDDRLI
jgi:hypothetical protein